MSRPDRGEEWTMNSEGRVVRPRRIRFSYPAGSLDRHYVQGDLVMSHLIAYLSGTFPEGEEFFVRSVKRFADRIADPDLKRRVQGFVGQELTHGREHRILNERLHAMGYRTDRVELVTKRVLSWYERVLAPQTCLAVTAALEHFTAVAAETLLTDERAQALLGETEVRSMLLWHAVEESEHRSVAFDVFRAVGGSERRRITAMRVITITFTTSIIVSTIISLLQDRAAYNPIRTVRSFAALRHSPFLTREVLHRLNQYGRTGFHPDDVDNTALLDHWTAELFGDNGTLADHLH
jgi:predicted metal-dependent hydrolase